MKTVRKTNTDNLFFIFFVLQWETGFVRILDFPDQVILRYQYFLIKNSTLKKSQRDLFFYLKNDNSFGKQLIRTNHRKINFIISICISNLYFTHFLTF